MLNIVIKMSKTNYVQAITIATIMKEIVLSTAIFSDDDRRHDPDVDFLTVVIVTGIVAFSWVSI